MTGKEKGASALVRNPLTVIAVFAGLAEVSATVALPQLEQTIQIVFVWFVMLFPTFLVGLFFLLLWQKHHVLYAPSDFSDENNFMRHWVPSSAPLLIEKEEEAADEEAVAMGPVLTPSSSSIVVPSENQPAEDTSQRNSERAAEARIMEDLVIRRMTKKFDLNFVRDVQLRGRSDIRYDAVAEGPAGPVMVEVKIIGHPINAVIILRRELERLAAVYFRMSRDELRGARLVLAIVMRNEISISEKESLRNRAQREIDRASLPMAVEFELFSVAELRSGEPA